jgi:hypothetical protein
MSVTTAHRRGPGGKHKPNHSAAPPPGAAAPRRKTQTRSR